MSARDALGNVVDLGQLALGALVLGPALDRLAARRPGLRDAIRHEPYGARGETFVATASLAAKAAFLAKMLGTDGARFRPWSAPRAPVDAAGGEDELLVTGDLLFPGVLGADTLSAALRARLARAGAVVVNLEGTLGDESQELAPLQTARGLIQLLSYAHDATSPGWASRLGAAGLGALLAGLPPTVLSVANNHTLDDGEDGFERTVTRARALGAEVVGDARRGHGGVVVPVDAHRVGLIALSYGHNRRTHAPQHLAFDRVPYALDHTRVAAIADDLRGRGATHLVALLHWGHEHEHEPTHEQHDCVATLLAAGFAAVVGHHPHLLQTSWTGGGRAVFYSLGDFIGGDRTVWSRLGAMASLRLRSGGRVEASLVPLAQTPYWRQARTMLLDEAPALERVAFDAFFRWKHRSHEPEAA